MTPKGHYALENQILRHDGTYLRTANYFREIF